MRVNDANTAGSAATELGRTQDVQKPESTSTAQSGNSDSSGDRVEFSSTLGQLSQAISSQDTQRSSRVQAVAAAYQNGTYRPNPAAISSAMVSDALSAGQV